MAYTPSKYQMPTCPQCDHMAYPKTEPEASENGPLGRCDWCGERFHWSVKAKFTSTCDVCSITQLTALLQPSQDPDGRVAPECPSDDCDGYMRSNYSKTRNRGPRSGRIDYRSSGPGAVELPLNTGQEQPFPPTDQGGEPKLGDRRDENPLPSAISEAKAERRREIERFLKDRRRRDRS